MNQSNFITDVQAYAFEIGVLARDEKGVYAQCIEKGDVEIYFEDGTADSHEAIFVCKKGNINGKYYMDKNLSELKQLIKINN